MESCFGFEQGSADWGPGFQDLVHLPEVLRVRQYPDYARIRSRSGMAVMRVMGFSKQEIAGYAA